MPKVEFHTSVEEVLECEDVQGFLIKKVNLGRRHLWTPFRAIHISTNIPSGIRTKILDTGDKSTIFEVNRVIYSDRSYEAIERSLLESDEDRIKNILRVNDRLSRENLSIPLSFSDFPHLKMEKQRFEELLDYIHAYSSIVFVPHIRYGEAKTKVKYSPKEFCEYVDDAVSILSDRNAKPLFVPFDINYDATTRDGILTHYAEKGYTNIWIDFQGKVFSGSMIAKMRTLVRKISGLFGEQADNVVLYLANIKKTPREAQRDFKISPSDFLGAFSYGDIIGSPWKGIVVPYQQSEEEPYWEKKGYSDEKEYRTIMFKRDCSIFEENSYYYWHPDKLQIKDSGLEEIRKSILQLDLSKKGIAGEISDSLNGFITLNELSQLRKIVENESKILDYIENKEFFMKDGLSILEKIRVSEKEKTKAEKEKGLFDFIEF
jgi:hypothetical protein